MVTDLRRMSAKTDNPSSVSALAFHNGWEDRKTNEGLSPR